MACVLIGTKSLLESVLNNCVLDSEGYISVVFESKCELFIQRETFENVCKLVMIFPGFNELSHYFLEC